MTSIQRKKTAAETPEQYDSRHRKELAQQCHDMLGAEVRRALQSVPQASTLIDEGKWKSAAKVIEASGFAHAAGLLRLETPIGLEH